MPMIEGIDGNKLIEAFRAGRKDRLLDQEADIKRRKGESELATEEQYRGLAGQVIRTRGGVAGQYGAKVGGGVTEQFVGGTTTERPLQMGESNPPLLDSSSPAPIRHRELSAAGEVGATPPSPPGAPSVPPMSAPADDPQHHVAYDPDILRRMTILKPQQGADIARAFKTMDEAEMKQRQAASDAMGVAAKYLRRFPQDQRQAHMAYVADHLRGAGISDEHISSANLSDEGLDAYQAVAIDYDHLHANELAERRLAMAQGNLNTDNARADRNTDSIIGDRAARRGETKRYHDQSDTTRRRGQDKPRAGRGAARPTATGPNGEKVEFDGKAWVTAK